MPNKLYVPFEDAAVDLFTAVGFTPNPGFFVTAFGLSPAASYFPPTGFFPPAGFFVTTAGFFSTAAGCFIGPDAAGAVARLLILTSTGSVFCAGWLYGNEGHFITNNHCISQQAHAELELNVMDVLEAELEFERPETAAAVVVGRESIIAHILPECTVFLTEAPADISEEYTVHRDEFQFSESPDAEQELSHTVESSAYTPNHR
ncbi:hypothetical protein PR002_g6919 [Phytophthora rubi]|uniref:Serine protease n=1 Tax=Phytophthora rubi TaxID=129364 RepID=A0A6A3MUF5_9STRA|nr:hypothetical protein PR002_g6919 [Phytophthora rubi]